MTRLLVVLEARISLLVVLRLRPIYWCSWKQLFTFCGALVLYVVGA